MFTRLALLASVAVSALGDWVHFESDGRSVPGLPTSSTEYTGGGWIQVEGVTFGLKRDIGSGGRVSGHTHYDRVEFDMPVGPGTPMLMELASVGAPISFDLRQIAFNSEGKEQEYMNIVCTDGRLAGVKVINSKASGSTVTVAVHMIAMEMQYTGAGGSKIGSSFINLE